MLRKITKFITIKSITIIAILLSQTLPIYSMEEGSKQYNDRDLPEILAHEYVINWIQPYTNNQKHVAERYNSLVEEYLNHESNLKTISQNPIASVMGGINFGMTLDEIERAIEQTFISLNKDNVIISCTEFEKIKGNYFELPRQDLTRIWGAVYLKNKINQSSYLSSKYDVPNYIIVMDNPSHIKINISFFTRIFPMPLKLENGFIYFKKITGKPVASCTTQMLNDIGIKSEIGFDDFANEGNIIQDHKTGVMYIIDTEFKSFKFPIPSQLLPLLEYAAERLIYLNGDFTEYIYEFDIAD